jgi:hypothetical protein
MHNVADGDPHRRTVFGLDESGTRDHIEELTSGVTVPVAACTRSELNGDHRDAVIGLTQPSVPDRPGEMLIARRAPRARSGSDVFHQCNLAAPVVAAFPT